MATIDEMRQWCETARKLLKTSTLKVTSGESKALKKHLNNVTDLLKQIEGDRHQIKLYKECVAEFERLQVQMELLAQEKAKSSDKEKDKAQHLLTQKFTELENKLQQGVTQAREEREHVERLSLKRAAYMKDYLAAVQAVELLKVVPMGDAAAVQQELDRIHEQSKQDSIAGFEVGCNSLKGLMPKIKKARETAESKRQEALKHAGNRPAAQKKIEEAQTQLAELERLVGIEATLKQYRGILEAAVELGRQNKWTDVLPKLEELKRLPKPKECEQESQRQVATLREVPRYEEGMGYVGKLEQLLPPDAVAPLRKTFVDALNALLAQQVKQKGLDAVSQAVDKLKAEVELRGKQREDLQALSLTLTNQMSELRGLASPLALLSQQAQFDQFVALLEGRQLDAATEVGQRLSGEVAGLLPEKRRDKENWLKRKSISANITKQLLALQQSKCEAVTRRVATAMAYASPQTITQLEQAGDWTRLVEDLEKARAQLAELAEMDRGFRAIADFRRLADEAVTQKASALNGPLQALDSAANEAQKKANAELFDATKGLRAEIVEAKRAWAIAMAGSTDEPALKTARDEALRVLQLIGEKAAAANSQEGIAALIEGREREKAGPIFERDWAVFERLLLQVRSMDNGATAILDDKGRKLRARAPLDYKTAVGDLALLIAEARSTANQAGRAQQTEHQKINQLGQEVLTEINRVKKESKNAKAFAEAFASLAAEHAELMLLGASTNLDAVKEAERGLIALKARAGKFAPATPGAGISLDKVVVALGDATRVFENLVDTLKTNNPRALVTLTSRLATLKTEIYAADPEDGMVKIAAFTKAVTEAETDAGKVAQIRTEFEQLLPDVETACDNFKQRKVAPEYAKVLQARLAEANKLAKTPAKLFDALTKLKGIDTEVKAAALDLQVAMGKEQGVRAQQHQDEATKKGYERSLKVCEDKYIGEAGKAVKAGGGDEGLLQELRRMLNVARQSAKQGDHAKALREVELTMERARQITADPYGPAIGARNNLPEDQRVWREALSGFQGALDKVAEMTLLAVPQAHADVKKKLQALLAGVKTKFDANVFEAPLRNLAAEGIDDNQRRSHREAALAKVRAVQATLAQNPQIQLLLSNPAAKNEFSLGYRRLNAALVRLEANISRCCR